MLVLLVLLAIGYVAGKTGIINQLTNERLTKVVINIVQPARILDSMTGLDNDISIGDAGASILAAASFYIIALPIAFITAKLMRTKSEDSGTYQYILTFGNVGFMGFPVIESVFGNEAMFYCALFNIPFNLLAYSIGLTMLTKKSGKFNLEPKRLLNMPFISAILALVLFLVKMPIPQVLASTFETLGGSTTPLAMLILGGTLAMLPIKELFTQWRIYIVTFIKLLVIPLVTWLVYRVFLGPDSLLLGVIVVLAAMPVATNATMIAIEYGGNQRVVSQSIFFTTVLCVVTIPFISYLLFL